MYFCPMKVNLRDIPKTYFLLFTILVFIFGGGLISQWGIKPYFNIIIYSVLFFGTYFSIEEKTGFVKILVIAGMILNFLLLFVDTKAVSVSVFILSALIFTIITLILIRQIARSKEVTAYMLMEAVNGYLLIGIVSVLLNSVAILLDPQSINFSKSPTMSDMIYYSYINLTTIGFGDIAPVTERTRMISIFTGLSGQLYLAVIIALIISKVSNRKDN